MVNTDISRIWKLSLLIVCHKSVMMLVMKNLLLNRKYSSINILELFFLFLHVTIYWYYEKKLPMGETDFFAARKFHNIYRCIGLKLNFT